MPAPFVPRKSTIVRFIMRTRLMLARIGSIALEPVAPVIPARWAVRQWLAPPRTHRRRTRPGRSWFTVPLAAAPGWRTRPRWGVPAGQRFRVADRIAAETWGTGPAVYLLHGWGGARTQLHPFVAPLVAAGFQVVALDAPAHGESGPGRAPAGRSRGRRTTLPEMAQALSRVAEVTGPPHAVIGHSAGCQAIAVALREGLPAQRLVFLAPIADPAIQIDKFHRLLGHGRRTRSHFHRLLERAVGRCMAEFDLPAQAAAADKPPPLLVIHDRDDKEIPPAEGEAIAAAWPDAALTTTSGLGHRRLLSDPSVVAEAVAFVAGHDSQAAAA